MKESKIKEIFYQIVLGVKHLHDKNLYHRDIKLDNILINKDFIPKICDFGISIVHNK